MANLALVFDVLAKDNASSTFRSVGDSAERAGKQTSGFGSQMAGAMKVAAGALLGAGLIEGFKSLYQAADESRKIAALTTQVIKSTGGAANVSAKQVGDLAAQIAKKTGVDDEAIQSGQNLLLTFTNVKNVVGSGNDIFNQATKTITDMSVALGQDTSSSAIQLGKALNDPIKGVTALQRVGVSFTASQKDQIRTLVESGDTLSAQKIILAELGKEFGGAAEAAATPLGKLQQRAGDLAEQIGGYLLPAVDKAATFFNDKLLPAFSDVGSTLAGVAIPAFKTIATVVGAVADVFNSLPGPLQAVAVALGAFALLKGPISGALETMGIKALYLKDAITSGGGLKGAFATLASAITPATLAITAATLILPSLIDLFKKMTGNSDSAAASQRTLAEALKSTNGVLDENARKAAQTALINEDIVDVLDRAGVSGKDAIDGLLGNAGAQDRVNEALQNYITTSLASKGPYDQQAAQVGDARDKYLQLAESLGMSKEQAQFFAGAVEGTGTAVGGTAVAVDDFAKKTEDARTALSDAKQATDDFKLSLDILSGANVSSIELESRFQAALDAADGATKNLSGSVLDASGKLDLHSEAGRKAADVLLDVRNTGNDLIATMIQQGATSDQVSAKDAELRASFIDTAKQMGISDAAALALADQILGIPASRNTVITADTTPATTAIDNLIKKIETAGGVHVATISGPAAGPGGTQLRNAFGNIVEAFAAGGLRSMRGGLAQIVKPNTWRVIGDRVKDDEAYIPINNSSRSQALLAETASRMGHRLMADGGMLAGDYTIPVGLAQATLASIQKKLMPVAGGPAGAGVQRWLPLVLASLNLVGQPGSLAQTVLRRMQQESGGNPRAINLTDINAQRGDPSKGLMQVIGSTFRAYAMPGHNSDVYDPLSNLLASERYALARYGSLSAAYNKAGGYDNGGPLMPGYTLAYNGTGKPENVQTAAQAAASQQPAQFTGNLYLDSGEFLGVVRGEATQVVAGALVGATNRGGYNR